MWLLLSQIDFTDNEILRFVDGVRTRLAWAWMTGGVATQVEAWMTGGVATRVEAYMTGGVPTVDDQRRGDPK